MDLWLWVLAGLGAFGAVIAVLSPRLERALMYAPDPSYAHPSATGLSGVEEVVMKTGDGERLICWWGAPDAGKPTLLYFHGNAGTLTDRAERLSAYRGRGFGIFIMSYRGYSGSSGRPSEAANVADALGAYDRVREFGVQPEDLFIYGESIGTGVAVQVAKQRPIRGLVLDAPYTSIVDVAEICYPHLPARLLMRDRYETLARHLPWVSAPLLVIHGEADAIIPVRMGRAIAEAAPAGGEIRTFPAAGHTDHYLYGSFEVVAGWIEARHAAPARSETAAA